MAAWCIPQPLFNGGGKGWRTERKKGGVRDVSLFALKKIVVQ
jgi:hypothetical protein